VPCPAAVAAQRVSCQSGLPPFAQRVVRHDCRMSDLERPDHGYRGPPIPRRLCVQTVKRSQLEAPSITLSEGACAVGTVDAFKASTQDAGSPPAGYLRFVIRMFWSRSLEGCLVTGLTFAADASRKFARAGGASNGMPSVTISRQG
jgi:hypothetical protein